MELRVIEESDGLTHVALEGELDIPGVNAVGDKFYFHLTARRKPAARKSRSVSGSRGCQLRIPT